MSTVDIINHPPHYTGHPSGVECIQLTQHMSFCLGNMLKYIWRAGLKHTGDVERSRREDIQKALWYVNQEITLRQNRRRAAVVWAEVQGLCRMLSPTWRHVEDLLAQVLDVSTLFDLTADAAEAAYWSSIYANRTTYLEDLRKALVFELELLPSE